LNGLRVAIVGDILNSRVARSNLFLLTRMGASVTLCGPPTLIPQGIERRGATVTHDVDEAVEGVDVVMTLRIQLERMRSPAFPSNREYAKLFGINRERVARAAPDAIVMHPGPMNRGVEITGDVADGNRSVILEQVTNGVAVRMAVLYLLAGEIGREAAA
jgi:aspartate carbamoyltransferase catalytic subunit